METKLSPEQLAKNITMAIMPSDERATITRIALKSGTWPDNEKDEGGFCISSLETLILETIKSNL